MRVQVGAGERDTHLNKAAPARGVVRNSPGGGQYQPALVEEVRDHGAERFWRDAAVLPELKQIEPELESLMHRLRVGEEARQAQVQPRAHLKHFLWSTGIQQSVTHYISAGSVYSVRAAEAAAELSQLCRIPG